MIPEQKAKALVAGGVAVFVVGLVILLLLVVPAARQGQVASAQDEEQLMEEPPMEGQPMEGGPGEEGFGPGAEMGAPGAPEAGPVEPPPPGEPLEASRPNPFAPRAAALGTSEEVRAAMAYRYGPNWDELPIAERVAFVRPEVPTPPVPPPPPMRPAVEDLLRITSIMWGADGQALAAYEPPDGPPGVLKPGDRVPGGWLVTEIRRNGVTLRNAQSGEIQQLELRARTEKKEPERPQRRQRPGGRRPARAPEEPPG